ncbi:MAG: hypothetical protein Q7U75_07870 [Desulfobacterales bacterium]|nr:hypothetical protein [Desulfobacterales bacterium]
MTKILVGIPARLFVTALLAAAMLVLGIPSVAFGTLYWSTFYDGVNVSYSVAQSSPETLTSTPSAKLYYGYKGGIPGSSVSYAHSLVGYPEFAEGGHSGWVAAYMSVPEDHEGGYCLLKAQGGSPAQEHVWVVIPSTGAPQSVVGTVAVSQNATVSMSGTLPVSVAQLGTWGSDAIDAVFVLGALLAGGAIAIALKKRGDAPWKP